MGRVFQAPGTGSRTLLAREGGRGLAWGRLGHGWEHNRLETGTPINNDMPHEAETSIDDSTELGLTAFSTARGPSRQQQQQQKTKVDQGIASGNGLNLSRSFCDFAGHAMAVGIVS